MARGPVVRKSAEAVSPSGEKSLGGVDHVDTVAVNVAPGTTPAEFAKAMMSSPPTWVITLMSVRDKIVKPFGLRGGAVREPGEVRPGASLGPMRVIEVSDAEVLAGKDDKHLSYRVVFVVRDGAHGPEGACSTVVRYNRASGKRYFTVIRPFHNTIMSSFAKRGGATLG
ncbi:DUF2867 domain-containing protein [Streptomyces sp. NPDC057702]|uniref:DUF2867 domain-containing protein n=1 Tax=unclassified Streptomyces TaxID=2593676 RepID=UPI003677E463